MQILRCDQCEKCSDAGKSGDIWRTVNGGGGRELDFCSWGCVGKYADAKVEAELREDVRKRLKDLAQPKKAKGST